MVPYNFYASLNKFVLLAIPFFILGGNIMEKAGISNKLIDFAQSLVGHIRGGMGMVCVIVSCFFAAISGSGPATVAALGMIIIPAMVKVGYPAGAAAAFMAVSLRQPRLLQLALFMVCLLDFSSIVLYISRICSRCL